MPSISVSGRDDKITHRHKVHAEEKVQKLQRYFNGIVKIEVVLGHTPTEAEAELIISVAGGKTIVCQARGKDPFAALDVVLDKAEVQLTRHKEKLKTHKRKGAGEDETPAADAAAGAQPDDGEAYQDIVEKRKFT
jgi:putative sigma-54 modulation protein